MLYKDLNYNINLFDKYKDKIEAEIIINPDCLQLELQLKNYVTLPLNKNIKDHARQQIHINKCIK